MGTISNVMDLRGIGADASGGVAARHLAEHGFKVVALEQGDWVTTQGDLPGDKLEYELAGAKQWHPDPRRSGGRPRTGGSRSRRALSESFATAARTGS
jgi:choline dehydrogenase-like flavoprotein